ncbi:hypothetical protein HRI_004682300 [Hibiscus trionum]|uniref:Reverse transcriptase domain-containing protein n=1 Tax=Hibiscus trionum TaxID=183268 RepID=A0A9W7J7J4_HIBTR|nr:hypothetical protein HRI_004682300 [Hibiscus trionum]
MGFGETWCKWIHLCISTAYVSVLVNGSPTAPFAIGRGLRQGCPLSPLLFNCVAEALSCALTNANMKGFFQGICIGKEDCKISHIQYADDLIVFCGAGETQIRNINRVLKGFEIAAGLKINRRKSKLMGINVDGNTVARWAGVVNCQHEFFPCKYLAFLLGRRVTQQRCGNQFWTDSNQNWLAGRPVIYLLLAKFY